MQETEIIIQITGRGSESPATEGRIRVVTWTPKDRTRRALKAWASCWGLAVLCVPIPIVHFTVLPALILTGPILAFWLNGQTSAIQGGSGPCPFCATAVPIARGPERFPATDLCSACHRELLITPKDRPLVGEAPGAG